MTIDQLSKSLLAVCFMFIMVLLLAGCGGYQPPGQDLWLTVR